jgi:hypothetical protein
MKKMERRTGVEKTESTINQRSARRIYWKHRREAPEKDA